MWFSTPLASVVDTIRLAVAPVFLLTGVGGLMAVMAGRLARIVDRAHVLNAAARVPGGLDANQRTEAGLIPRRLNLIKRAILMSVTSALAVCLVIALLFVSSLVDLSIGTAVAFVFIASMLLMMGGLYALFAEVRLTLRVLHVFSIDAPADTADFAMAGDLRPSPASSSASSPGT